ncbi:hypothetical protein K435DRAFT_789934 [Dendrothele bispora CBS 962.96]|uniref:Uncharacterized protein n=1 Tax=Dendrothele bispora (strain CBS 962.96) TaxID=1314807 RepID=A0A4S8MTF6_DENBC|nr:hypothetical protein K435DRAFT_789934 [Dendrothele bispora CBS 962.96]
MVSTPKLLSVPLEKFKKVLPSPRQYRSSPINGLEGLIADENSLIPTGTAPIQQDSVNYPIKVQWNAMPTNPEEDTEFVVLNPGKVFKSKVPSPDTQLSHQRPTNPEEDIVLAVLNPDFFSNACSITGLG